MDHPDSADESSRAVPTQSPSDSPHVTLVAGDDRRVVDPADAPWRTVTDSFLCASGERWGGEWRGVPVAWLLERAPGDDAATHLRIHGAGDHVACVSLADALGGVLAVERGDDRLPPADRPRFVAPGVVAARTVKAVRRLELIELAPDEDAEAYEALANVD
ncbi:molybdopterin-dependent oxidoreductase [Haloplanus aerogenes]|uniref:Molybdopterin-dependent oxidoreductase-like protein n=1 Tax=Haloplanus aerogenes TaxID=660522 RepID=A0A3M0DRF3_9EURY|nr:molybdopterin-dependent oxidoreductase [Haloplanus aerogenes]AZH24359.1 pterin operon protein [Haloplanus aerogenes]RMB24005.1 molybdopterin-dependent oxidoreductase-like protein [Haloplanus aerogenes]